MALGISSHPERKGNTSVHLQKLDAVLAGSVVEGFQSPESTAGSTENEPKPKVSGSGQRVVPKVVDDRDDYPRKLA